MGFVDPGKADKYVKNPNTPPHEKGPRVLRQDNRQFSFHMHLQKEKRAKNARVIRLTLNRFPVCNFKGGSGDVRRFLYGARMWDVV